VLSGFSGIPEITPVRYYKRLKFTRRAIDEFKERSQVRVLAA
jgi:hypothetical protein